ncbi:hypothetical protein QFC22_005817 [Naganishia vaughanmartiniae]|uniref:Uncharacterized protein n=1 Tax=Naganishia vaughanmartiniae TaxID=1424756 RepID=A0ACC2WS64_9TREE|nr:hypothetical protein QFC22_005817 [Naganishia vaughanmartiniae]
MPLSPKLYTWLCGYDLGVIANVIISPDFLRVTNLDSKKASDSDYIGFISEIAHPSIRGRLTTLQQFCLGIGALIASIIAYELEKNHKGSVFQWRFPLGFQIAPAIPLALLIPLFPEVSPSNESNAAHPDKLALQSPRWLMLKGRKEEALHNLARLHARGDINDAFVQAEYAELDAKVSAEAQIHSGWVEVFRGPSNLRRVFLGIILQFSVQMTGVSVIQYYAPEVFAAIGFSYEKTFLFQTINSVIALVAQVLCILTVDRAKYPASVGNTSAGYAFVMMTWIYNFAFSYGIGPLSWAYPVEIMNTATRAKGTALTSMSCWIANFFIAQITPRAIKAIGWRYYICFSVMSFTNAITIYLLFPETKGVPLEAMDDMFNRTGWIYPLSTYRPDYVGHGEEQLRKGQLHVETGYEPSVQKEKAEIEQEEDKQAY